jgi:hypothetical protein
MKKALCTHQMAHWQSTVAPAKENYRLLFF